MYALIEYKGKQYKAEKDALITVDKLDAKEGENLEIGTVLLVSDEKNVRVGAPYVEGALVKAIVEDSFKDKKVIVFKHKSKKDYYKTQGHRQQYTNIRISDIVVA